ncbi:uncharacterized protein VTP21DRAFT_2724 [Calcarisporiella thermophila]|uniref:uncharacterized protein n=1 Tax=Calcarisporiella thermophila TaxID=911321 RepID=UPI0037427277
MKIHSFTLCILLILLTVNAAAVVPREKRQVHDDHNHDHSITSPSRSLAPTNSASTLSSISPNSTTSPNPTSPPTPSQDHAHDHNHEQHSEEQHNHAGHSHGSAPELTEAEIAELCRPVVVENYNTNLQIAGFFIILVAGSLGVFIPIGVKRYASRTESVANHALLLGKFFGTGVILATAFVHMLLEAFARFASPCLPSGFRGFSAWAPVFCMIAAMLIQLIEYLAIERADHYSKNHDHRQQHSEHSNGSLQTLEEYGTQTGKTGAEDGISSGSHSQELHHHHHHHGAGLLEGKDASRHIGTLMLEFGILLHSIIIGVSLGVTSGREHITLLIALSFHQFFEGVALGTRIAELNYNSLAKPLIMALVFALTTPLGIGIGIGVHRTYEGNYGAGLLVQAIFDSLAAGILMYSVFVELIAMEINHNRSFRRLRPSLKFSCFISMYIGIVAMSVLGKYL